MRVVYIAHPLGGGDDREKNRKNAARWCAYLAKVAGICPVADWIVLSGEWEESPENRELGIRCAVELVKRCDELWMFGGRITPGMSIEASVAKEAGIPVVDMTHLGYEAPCV